MKKILLLAICSFVYAESLSSLLEYATSHNKIVQAKKYTELSKQKELESNQNAYYPSVDIGAAYQSSNIKTPGVAGDIYNGYAKIGVDLYDGGKKSSLVSLGSAQLESSKYDTLAYKQALQLSIIQDFYGIKNIEATLRALEEKQNQLQAELERIKMFYEVGSATKDDIDKLQAALSNNAYDIDASKFQLLSSKKLFALSLGKPMDDLDDSKIIEPENIDMKTGFGIKALEQESVSLSHLASLSQSGYNPQVRLEDTLSFYDYGRSDAAHFEGIDQQNKLLLSVNWRVFDNGVVTKKKESYLVQKMALEQQIEQQKEEQNINVSLAQAKITTAKALIRSAKTSLEAAISAYDTIAKKYQVGVLDNIAYLDALSVRTNAKAQYEKALNDLQVAFGAYYFYTNQDIRKYIQ